MFHPSAPDSDTFSCTGSGAYSPIPPCPSRSAANSGFLEQDSSALCMGCSVETKSGLGSMLNTNSKNRSQSTNCVLWRVHRVLCSQLQNLGCKKPQTLYASAKCLQCTQAQMFPEATVTCFLDNSTSISTWQR